MISVLGIGVNAAIGSVFSDVLLGMAVMALDPFRVSLGLTLTIPLSMLMEGRSRSVWAWTGAALQVVGLGVIANV
jgi:hypothetical protein